MKAETMCSGFCLAVIDVIVTDLCEYNFELITFDCLQENKVENKKKIGRDIIK